MARRLTGKEKDGRLLELAEAPLGRLVARYSWPAIVSMTLNGLYAVVDRFWVGHGCGQDAMAALTLAFPLMMVFGAIGVLFGVGHGAVLSIRLGEKNREEAERMLGQMVFLKVVFSLVMPPLVFWNLDALLRLTGGAGVTPGAFAAAKSYLEIVLFSHVFSHVAFGLSGTMRAEGAALPSMVCMIVGFGVNVVLDPLFIFGLGLGVDGAAWATDVAMFVSCAWALAWYGRGKSAVRLRWRNLRVWRGKLVRPLAVGLAPFLQQTIGAFIGFSLQLAFAKWAASPAEATLAMASLGFFQALMLLCFTPLMGLQQGLAPVIGYNWGARDFARVLKALVLGFWVTTAICFAGFVLQEGFATPLARLFSSADDAGFVVRAAKDLRVGNVMVWCIGLNVVCTTYFQAIGRPKTAILLSTLRQAGCLIPCTWLLPYFFADPLLGIWLAFPVSDALACVATIPPYLRHVRFLRHAGKRGGA